MHLKMMTSMGGPDLSIANGDEIPFGESFPFSAAEVHRFRANEIAVFVGTAEEIAAWLKANPERVEAAIVDDTDAREDDAAKANADAAKAAAPPAERAGKPANSPAAKKA